MESVFPIIQCSMFYLIRLSEGSSACHSAEARFIITLYVNSQQPILEVKMWVNKHPYLPRQKKDIEWFDVVDLFGERFTKQPKLLLF